MTAYISDAYYGIVDPQSNQCNAAWERPCRRWDAGLGQLGWTSVTPLDFDLYTQTDTTNYTNPSPGVVWKYPVADKWLYGRFYYGSANSYGLNYWQCVSITVDLSFWSDFRSKKTVQFITQKTALERQVIGYAYTGGMYLLMPTVAQGYSNSNFFCLEVEDTRVHVACFGGNYSEGLYGLNNGFRPVVTGADSALDLPVWESNTSWPWPVLGDRPLSNITVPDGGVMLCPRPLSIVNGHPYTWKGHITVPSTISAASEITVYDGVDPVTYRTNPVGNNTSTLNGVRAYRWSV